MFSGMESQTETALSLNGQEGLEIMIPCPKYTSIVEKNNIRCFSGILSPQMRKIVAQTIPMILI